ncbi:hypothetical protein [Myxacorys almedinensis]|uniref:Uncharacterized protein n=1 Tax=Myxacorys almedinensis A TaxID=2690445 RepID=A0A8J7Z463_9CYAN|nr:hypothetical protein [Myxacorys almedinensis]NDJ17851.1 hypothetical protein [Myxacorys almedinensis A]
MNPHSHDFDQFPFWAYLNQPFFDPSQPFIFNPRAFSRYYKVQQLEHCWRLSERRLLEHCWRQDSPDKQNP